MQLQTFKPIQDDESNFKDSERIYTLGDTSGKQ